MAKRRCPLCWKLCRVAADSKSGYCRTHKKRWRVERVPAEVMGKLRPGPVVHETLPPILLNLIGWSYRVVGRYVRRTLEEWELGFMRDILLHREALLWHRIAFAFITYHRMKKLPLRPDVEEKRLVDAFIDITLARQPPGDDGDFVVECFNSPDGWREEINRFKLLVGVDIEEARWEPPDRYLEWPPPADFFTT